MLKVRSLEMWLGLETTFMSILKVAPVISYSIWSDTLLFLIPEPHFISEQCVLLKEEMRKLEC